MEDAHGHGIENGLIPLLIFPQCFLSPLLLGDVAPFRYQILDAPIRVVNRVHAILDPYEPLTSLNLNSVG